MRVLLDECLPRKLKSQLPPHEVSTVPEMGWSGTKNGALLRLAAASFDVFVTADQNLQYQQNLRTAQIGVVVFVVPNTLLETLQPLIPEALKALGTVQPGEFVRVG